MTPDNDTYREFERIVVWGNWRCGFTGLEWEGDISDHHGLPPGVACPGPHLRVAE